VGHLHLDRNTAVRPMPREADPHEDVVAACPGLLRLDRQVQVRVVPARELAPDRRDTAMYLGVWIVGGDVILGVLAPEIELRNALARVHPLRTKPTFSCDIALLLCQAGIAAGAEFALIGDDDMGSEGRAGGGASSP
jgi:hypothetical protein